MIQSLAERRARVKAALAAMPRDDKHFAIQSYRAIIKQPRAGALNIAGSDSSVRIIILQTLLGDQPELAIHPKAIP